MVPVVSEVMEQIQGRVECEPTQEQPCEKSELLVNYGKINKKFIKEI